MNDCQKIYGKINERKSMEKPSIDAHKRFAKETKKSK